jgi:CubicO group peptidase (beta-lactamase class C family)
MMSISAEVAADLQTRLDVYTSKQNGIPGLVYTVINKEGEVLLNLASGKRGVGIDQPMTTDTVFWLASCTKMITAIAAMQLVESQRLALDDVNQVEEIAPELKRVKVLEEAADGSLKLVEKKRGITLRMLLSHTGESPVLLQTLASCGPIWKITPMYPTPERWEEDCC